MYRVDAFQRFFIPAMYFTDNRPWVLIKNSVMFIKCVLVFAQFTFVFSVRTLSVRHHGQISYLEDKRVLPKIRLRYLMSLRNRTLVELGLICYLAKLTPFFWNIFVLPKPYRAACLWSVIFLPLVITVCKAYSCKHFVDICRMKCNLKREKSQILLFFLTVLVKISV